MLLQLLVCIAVVLVGYARAFITHPTRHRCAARGYELVCVVYGSYESYSRSMNTTRNIHKLCMLRAYVYDALQIAAKCKRLFSLCLQCLSVHSSHHQRHQSQQHGIDSCRRVPIIAGGPSPYFDQEICASDVLHSRRHLGSFRSR